MRKNEIALTATVFKLQLASLAHLSFTHCRGSLPNLGHFRRLLIFSVFLTNKVRESSLHPEYIRNCGFVFELRGAATAAVLDQFQQTIWQNDRDKQSFQSYFLSRAVR